MGPHTYHLVDTAKKFQAFYREFRKQKRVAFDLETTGLDPLQSEIVGYSFSWKPGEAWYLAVRGPEGAATLDPEQTRDQLAKVLEDGSVAKVNQNIKFDVLTLRAQGVKVAGLAGDGGRLPLARRRAQP